MSQKAVLFFLFCVVFVADLFSQRPLPRDLHRTSGRAAEPEPMARWEFRKGTTDVINDLPGHLIGNAKIKNGRLLLDGNGSYFKSAALPFALSEKTMVAQVYVNRLDQGGGGLVTVESLNGVTFDSIVFAEGKPRVWNNGSEHGIRIRGAEGQEESGGPSAPIWMAITYQPDGTIALYRNGTLYRSPFNPGTPLQHFEKGKTDVLIGKRHEGGGNAYLQGEVDFVEIYNRALTDEEVRGLFLRGNFTGQSYRTTEVTQKPDDLPQKLLQIPHEPYSPELVRKAEEGDAQAQMDLGYAIFYGKGVAKSYEQSVSWYEKSAAQANANAINNLANCYEKGQGVGQDMVKAASLYRQAAEAGFGPAQDNYALMLCRGTGVPKNVPEAFRWHLKSAQQGWRPAFARVAAHYSRGSGVEQNHVEAGRWRSLAEATKEEWEKSPLANDWESDEKSRLVAGLSENPGRTTSGVPAIRRKMIPIPSKNPFGVKDVGEIPYDQIRQFASQVSLPGHPDDANAKLWCGDRKTGEALTSLEGAWSSRWNQGSSGTGWMQGTAQIKSSGESFYILYEDDGKYLVEAKIEQNLLLGKYVNLNNERDAGPWVGKIVGNDRIDGQWARGRWDFRR